MNNNSCMNRTMNQNMYGQRMMHSGCGREMRSDMRSDSKCDMRGEDKSCDSTRSSEIPTGNRKALLCFINEVSFAVYETLLYLDTHPSDQEAMEFFRRHNQLRERALKEHARLYGPLTISTADDCESNCWEWMNQPWPWEGGDC